MVNERPDQHRSFIGRDEIDEVFSRANLNPERVGCPPREELEALARRARPIDDPRYAHLAECSACYREFRDIQEARAQDVTSWAPTWRRPWIALTTAALVVALLGLAWFLRPGGDLPRSILSEQVRAELDLRGFNTGRSYAPTADAKFVTLPIGIVELSILLPVGFEPGVYDVDVFDGNLKSHGAARGVAEIRNYVTTLETTVDLRHLAAGNYHLGIRRQGDDWRMFPARVR